MDPYRLKLKVGEHEFEAEGPVEAVQSQFETWKELIASAHRQKDDTPARNAQQGESEQPQGLPLQMDKIFRAEGRVVSLTALPSNEQEAALLILLGQRHYRSNDSVTGSEVMDGLQLSGYRLGRVDRMLDRLAADGVVIRTGQHRGTRYRLSNTGLASAQSIAREVIGRVA
jgi:hypothetical protein